MSINQSLIKACALYIRALSVNTKIYKDKMQIHVSTTIFHPVYPYHTYSFTYNLISLRQNIFSRQPKHQKSSLKTLQDYFLNNPHPFHSWKSLYWCLFLLNKRFKINNTRISLNIYSFGRQVVILKELIAFPDAVGLLIDCNYFIISHFVWLLMEISTQRVRLLHYTFSFLRFVFFLCNNAFVFTV